VDDESRTIEDRLLGNLRLIVVALAAGSLTFLVVAVVVAQQEAVPVVGNRLASYAALGLVCVGLAVRLLVRQVLAISGRRRILASTFRFGRPADDSPMAQYMQQGGDRAKLFALSFARTIVSAAMIEGAAFLVLVVYLALDRWPGNLLVAGLLIGFILLHFPTRGATDSWLDHQQRLLDDERQLAR